jgi:hypothetical protein
MYDCYRKWKTKHNRAMLTYCRYNNESFRLYAWER